MALFITQSDQVPEKKPQSFLLEDGREIFLVKLNGRIFALDNSCPHMGAPLNEGEMEGCLITCPWHGYQFDVTNGACVNVPGYNATSYKIEVKDNKVYLME